MQSSDKVIIFMCCVVALQLYLIIDQSLEIYELEIENETLLNEYAILHQNYGFATELLQGIVKDNTLDEQIKQHQTIQMPQI